MPTKKEITEEVKGRGETHWAEFVSIREALKAGGHPALAAWNIAYQKVCGGHLTDEAAVIAAYDDMASKSGTAARKSIGQQRRRAVERNAASMVPTAFRKAEAAKEALKLSAHAVEMEKRRVGIVSSDTADGMLELLGGVDLARDDTPAEAVIWVARNACRAEPEMGSCPGAIAFGMWKWVRESGDNEREFWKVLTQKTVQGMDQSVKGEDVADMPLRELIGKLKGEVVASA